MCPHVLLQQKGISVPNTQSIFRNELMIFYDITQAKGGIRNSLKVTAGLYWIHLAIFWNKERLIRDSRQQSEIYVFAEKQTRNAHQRLSSVV
jgi:hypothetical protein